MSEWCAKKSWYGEFWVTSSLDKREGMMDDGNDNTGDEIKVLV